MVTYYVVQTFSAGRRGALVAEQAVQAIDEAHCRRMAERLSRSKDGVLAFSRAGDPSTGEFEDAQILYGFGKLPPVDGVEIDAEEFKEDEEEVRCA